MPFPDLPDRLREVRQKIDAAVARGGHGQGVKIIAVTKTHGPDAVFAAEAAGIEDVGENRVQEAESKWNAAATSLLALRWHLIGHLQRNKVKSLFMFSMLHSLDSARLADAVNGYALEVGAPWAPFDVLMQVNVVGEESKGGFARGEWEREAERLRGLGGLRVRGVMTMAPLEADEQTLRTVFAGARDARDVLRAAGHEATELSMGMSNDYEIAVEEGATYVRLGTVLFGARS